MICMSFTQQTETIPNIIIQFNILAHSFIYIRQRERERVREKNGTVLRFDILRLNQYFTLIQFYH